MTDFRYRVEWTLPSGVTTDVESPTGGASQFASIVKDAAADVAPTAGDVGRELVKTLEGRRSRWPAAGATANFGPWSQDVSRRMFYVRQGRIRGGRFGAVVILNRAVNRSGRPYAGFVERGIVGPNRFNPSRFARPRRLRANVGAVRRTWLQNSARIVDAAIARRRRGR